MGLEHADDASKTKPFGCGERRLDLGRMMAIVINDRDAVYVAHMREATVGTLEERERLGGLHDVKTTHVCRRDGGGGIGHVVPAGVRLDGHLDRS